jgi:lipopolysaccharide assembly outer membrane protein LptD (OstA)
MQLDEMEREKKNWAIIFSHSYSTNKSDFEKNDFSSSLRTSISAKITKNWAVTYDNYINLKENELVSHNFTVTREMHCWKLFFRYTKQGDYWNYRLQFFNIKLPDALKFRTSGHS